MPNKTIYVSEEDLKLFDEAKKLAGSALSSVISTALREYVERSLVVPKDMKEISVTVGGYRNEVVKKFVGTEIDDWVGKGEENKWAKATIYFTQKGNWVVFLSQLSKEGVRTRLLIGKTLVEFENKIPEKLFNKLDDLMRQNEKKIEYLDI